MITELTKLIIENWPKLPISSTLSYQDGKLFFTKFCQHIVGRNTKVLFFVSYRGCPVCIIKITRDSEFNERLKKEKEIQRQIRQIGVLTPSVYFDGFVGGNYFYAEQVIWGKMCSRRQIIDKQEKIIKQVMSFPVAGEIKLGKILDLFEGKIFNMDKSLSSSLSFLSRQSMILKKGMTHGDLGRPNLLTDGKDVYLIDWERASDIPLWLFDAVYLFIKIYDVRSFNDWKKNILPSFVDYAKVEIEYADTLYHLVLIFDILYKRYPAEYAKIAKQLSM